jgi:hypothetical protein
MTPHLTTAISTIVEEAASVIKGASAHSIVSAFALQLTSGTSADTIKVQMTSEFTTFGFAPFTHDGC